MEAGRGLRNSLVKPPLKAGTAVAQGLIGVVVQNLWEGRLHNSFEQPLPLFDCPRGGSFPLHLVWTSVLAYVLCLLSSCHAPLRGAWFHLLGTLFILTWRAGFSSLYSPSYPKPCLLPAKQAHSPSLALRGKCSTADCLGGPLLKSLHFINVFLILQGPELNTAYQMWSNSKGWFEQEPCSQQRKKKTISNHCQYTFEKKESSKLTVITIGKFQVRAGNGDAHSIPGSFNGQVWKCKQVATHLCLKVKWAWTAKFSSRKHRVTYVYPEHLKSCEWMDSTFYYSFQWTASFLTHCLPGI